MTKPRNKMSRKIQAAFMVLVMPAATGLVVWDLISSRTPWWVAGLASTPLAGCSVVIFCAMCSAAREGSL